MNEILNTLGRGRSAETVLDVESLPGLELFPGERKVRRMFIFTSGELLTIATDRIGAFDQPHLTENGRPAHYSGKGIITTNFTIIGKANSGKYMPTDHINPTYFEHQIPKDLYTRATVSLMANRIIPVEFIVRSTAEGSLAEKAQAGKKCCGQDLPKGIRLGETLPRPYFTPSTKAPKGEKDQDLDIEGYYHHVGDKDLANYLYGMALLLHLFNRSFARRRGLDRPDQKFEFGIFDTGLRVQPNKFITEIIDLNDAQHTFSNACEESGLIRNSWREMPGFDLNAFLRFAVDNARSGIIRLVDETWGTDDGRYRLLEDTKMGLRLYGLDEPAAAELFMKNYLCKEYFRSESKRTGRGGYDKDAGQTVTIPDLVMEETGRRNLMALWRMMLR